jgi:tetratricopeptide (TPR) repeat protein
MAQVRMLRKEYDAALSAAHQAFALNPLCEVEPLVANTYLGRAGQRIAAGDVDGAIGDLGAAIEILQRRGAVVDLARALMTRGNLQMRQGHFGAVVRDLTAALALQPDDAAGYNSRGFAYFQLGDYQRAVDDYTTALTLADRNGQAYYNRAYAYAKLGRYRQAAADVAAAARLGYPVEPQFVDFLEARERELNR